MQLPSLDRARVLVTGDVMLDRYCQGEAARLSPEAPVPIVQVEDMTDRPGGAGNVAMNLAALGAQVVLAAASGDDPGADGLESMLDAAGVECDLVRMPGHATTTKLRVLARHQQLLRLDFDAPFSPPEAVPLAVAARLGDSDILVLSDYGKGAMEHAALLLSLAASHKVPVFVDPRGPDFSPYHGVALLTPNLSEFEACVGPCADEAELVARGHALVASLSLGALLLTRGEQGMTLFQPGEPEQHFPASAREVFDVTGAGDTVIAVAAAAVAAGAPLSDAVAAANAGAGIVVGRMGAATVNEPELRAVLAGRSSPGNGVLSAAQLEAETERARARGEKLVFTNGCFDVLHAGHVAYLEEARSMGDRLVVAVNSDASVRDLKGPGRPVNPLERRMAVLAGLSSIDWVVAFAEATPEHLLARLRPDILVKGGDYDSVDDVVGKGTVEAYGGEVRLASKVEQSSTTAILEKARGVSKD